MPWNGHSGRSLTVRIRLTHTEREDLDRGARAGYVYLAHEVLLAAKRKGS